MAKFIDILQKKLSENKEKRLYTHYEGFDVIDSVTYGEFNNRVTEFASYLQRIDSAGERALILLPSSIDYITAYFSCLFTKTIAVPLYVPDDNVKSEVIRHILSDNDAQYIITTKKYYDLILNNLGEEVIEELFVCFVDDFVPGTFYEEHILDHDIAYLQYTSGSTSQPKGVMVTYNNIYENCRIMKKHFHITENDVFSTWLPFYFDMGLIGSIINTIFNGASNYFTSPEGFMKNPFSWLNSSSIYNGTVLIAPNFAYEMCLGIESEKLDKIDLSSVRITLNGSELVRDDTMQVLASKMENYKLNPKSFNPAYGLAENTLVVSAHEPGCGYKHVVINEEGLRNNEIQFCDKGLDIVSSGKICEGINLKIIDLTSGTELAQNNIGEIWISGKSVAKGYWNVDADTAFHNHLKNDDAQYFATGDLGFLHDGYLYVVGRKKDIIIIRGKNFYSQDIEEVVLKDTGENFNAAAAFSINKNNSEELIVFVEKGDNVKKDDDILCDLIKTVIVTNCKILPLDIIVFGENSLPRTGSGKLQRNKCRELYLEMIKNETYN